VDDILRQTLQRLSQDTKQLLDWEAARLLALRREAGIVDSSPGLLDCEGHRHHEEDDRDD